MSDRLTFGDIHRLLTELGFERERVKEKPYILFEHKSSGVMFMFRPHRSNERIDSLNLSSVQLHLVQNGFLEEEAFEEELDRLAANRTANARKK